MEYILLKLLFMTVTGTAVFAAVTFVSRLCRRLPHSWHYYIYLLPVLAFLLTTLPKNVQDVYNVQNTQGYAYTEYTPVQTDVEKNVSKQASEAEKTAGLPQNTADTALAEVQHAPVNVQNIIRSVPAYMPMKSRSTGRYTAVLFWIYVSGVLFSAVKRMYAAIRLKKRVKTTCFDAPQYMTDALEEVKCSIGMRREVRIYATDAGISPFMYGIFKPCIIVPLCVSEQEIDTVLMHELTHIQRYDLLYKLLLHFVCTVHWFNPIVYVMRYMADKETELSCDEAVSRKMDAQSRKSYSMSLLRLMRNEYSADMKNAVCMAESVTKSVTRQRLEVIMMSKNTSIKLRITGAVTAVIMAVCTVCTAFAVNSANPADKYAILNTENIGRFSYTRRIQNEREIGVDDGTGSGRAVGKAVFINTPVKKEFSISANIPSYRIENGSTVKPDDSITENGEDTLLWIKTDNILRKENVNVEVVMDEFIKTLDNGNVWAGKFTVMIDGNEILKNTDGYIENVPYAKENRDFTSVRVFRSATKEYVTFSNISFGLKTYDVLKTNKAEYEARNEVYDSDATCLEFVEQGKDKNSDKYGTARLIPDKKKLEFIYEDIQEYIMQDYSYSSNKVSGMFHTSYIDEFYGTVEGIDGEEGDTLTLKSADGRVNKAFTITSKSYFTNKRDENTSYIGGELKYAINSLTNKEYTDEEKRLITDMNDTNEYIIIDLAGFPFDIAFAPDKKSVTLTKKSGIEYDGWYATMATYNSPDEWNIWEERFSRDNENGCTFPVFNDNYSRHYINLALYKSEPYGVFDQYEISFFMYGGDILYTNVSKNKKSTPNISGEAFVDLMKINPQTRWQAEKILGIN